MTEKTIDHPFFARMWTVMSAHESRLMRRLRTENLAGLTGRVLEVGAGTGTNFAHYPDTVTEVVAVEPEIRLVPKAREAAVAAPVPVRNALRLSTVGPTMPISIRHAACSGRLSRSTAAKSPGRTS